MKIGIIGTGARSLAYIAALREQEQHEIAAICDADPARLETVRQKHFPDLPPERAYTDYRALLADTDLAAVLICTPDTTHREIALAAADAGKAMLLEKPVATTIGDVRDMLSRLEGAEQPIFLGFVLRYAQFFRQIKAVLESGQIGQIVTLQAREMLDTRHASSFFRRWHRFSRNNGGLMNAKCSHDLDLLNWFVGSDPVAVSAFGGNRIFVPHPDAAARCRDCALRAACLYAFDDNYYQKNFGTIHALADLCVYNSDKDIVDHECMLIRYADGTVAQFELCLFGHEENRTLTIHGTQAVLEADFLRGDITVRPLKGDAIAIPVSGPTGGHGGGDAVLLAELLEATAKGKQVNHIRAGCLATLTALAGEISMETGQTVKLDQLLAEAN